MRALFTAATGMEAQQLRIDAIANNIANVATTGYKKSRAEFEDLFYEMLKAPGAVTANGNSLPIGIQLGHGVKLSGTQLSFTQGDRVDSGRDLDFAIDGDGFFQIERPSGDTVYTRDGSFKLDSEGNIVNAMGQPLIPAVQVPSNTIALTVTPDGTISAQLPGQTDLQDLGEIELARFANPAGLRQLGNNQYAATEASGDAETGTPDDDGFGAISQGMLEMSNVNVAEELVQMILAQRAFELNSRVIQAGDQMMQTAGALSR